MAAQTTCCIVGYIIMFDQGIYLLITVCYNNIIISMFSGTVQGRWVWGGVWGGADLY